MRAYSPPAVCDFLFTTTKTDEDGTTVRLEMSHQGKTLIENSEQALALQRLKCLNALRMIHLILNES